MDMCRSIAKLWRLGSCDDLKELSGFVMKMMNGQDSVQNLIQNGEQLIKNLSQLGYYEFEDVWLIRALAINYAEVSESSLK